VKKCTELAIGVTKEGSDDKGHDLGMSRFYEIYNPTLGDTEDCAFHGEGASDFVPHGEAGYFFCSECEDHKLGLEFDWLVARGLIVRNEESEWVHV
jgi:hypothetical protein